MELIVFGLAFKYIQSWAHAFKIAKYVNDEEKKIRSLRSLKATERGKIDWSNRMGIARSQSHGRFLKNKIFTLKNTRTLGSNKRF